MLGISNGLMTGGYVTPDILLASYSSNFTDDVDGWIAIGIEDDSDDLTLEHNQTFNGTPGWLKGTFAEDQSSDGGIRMNTDHGTWAPASGQEGDYIVYSYTIYLDDASTWGGNAPVSTDLRVLELNFRNQVTPATVFSVTSASATNSEFLTLDAGYDRQAPNIMWFVASDEPLAGAIFYVKDIEVKLYRPA